MFPRTLTLLKVALKASSKVLKCVRFQCVYHSQLPSPNSTVGPEVWKHNKECNSSLQTTKSLQTCSSLLPSSPFHSSSLHSDPPSARNSTGLRAGILVLVPALQPTSGVISGQLFQDSGLTVPISKMKRSEKTLVCISSNL